MPKKQSVRASKATRPIKRTKKSLLSPAIKVPLIITAIGVLVTLLIIPYYAFNLGIKPCEGLPTDPLNCGDADFGGVVFAFYGGTIMYYGLTALAVGAILKMARPNFDEKHYLTYVYIFLAALIGFVLLGTIQW